MSKPDRTLDLLLNDEEMHGLRLVVPGEWLPEGSRKALLKLRVSTEMDQAAFIYMTAPQMKRIGAVLIREAERMNRRYAKNDKPVGKRSR